MINFIYIALAKHKGLSKRNNISIISKHVRNFIDKL